jgi:hypothetical protein
LKQHWKENSLFSGGGNNSIGKINGNTVSAEEYGAKITRYEDGLKLINPNIQFNDQMRSQVQDEVWSTMAADQLLGETYNSLGLGISEGEMGELMWGTTTASVGTTLFNESQRSKS